MTKIRILASALLAAASLGTMSAANAVVPGSDTAVRAEETAAIQSVIEGSAAPRGMATEGQASYGFPLRAAATAGGALVPGSRSVDDAAERDAAMSVVVGTSGAGYAAGSTGIGAIVPGSDSF